MSEKKSHLKWIDAAKGVAILAVIVDHSTGVLFSNRIISLSSYFSVTVFVFLAGITSFYSSERHSAESIRRELLRKVKGIVIPYSVATCIYQLVRNGRFDLVEYINHLLHFDIVAPFYFVVFFLQLLIISPYIYKMIMYKKGKMCHCIILFFAIIMSIFCIRYTFILDVYGGGKYLFGGSYLIVYLLGEMFAFYGFPFVKKKNIFKVVISLVAMCVCLLWFAKFEFSLDYWLKEPFGTGLNPPGITLMIYSGCIITLLYYTFAYIEFCKVELVQIIYKSLSLIGRYSLYVFLYHRLVLDYFLSDIHINNIWLKRVVYIVAMIGFPIIIKMIWDKIHIHRKLER